MWSNWNRKPPADHDVLFSHVTLTPLWETFSISASMNSIKLAPPVNSSSYNQLGPFMLSHSKSDQNHTEYSRCPCTLGAFLDCSMCCWWRRLWRETQTESGGPAHSWNLFEVIVGRGETAPGKNIQYEIFGQTFLLFSLLTFQSCSCLWWTAFFLFVQNQNKKKSNYYSLTACTNCQNTIL